MASCYVYFAVFTLQAGLVLKVFFKHETRELLDGRIDLPFTFTKKPGCKKKLRHT